MCLIWLILTRITISGNTTGYEQEMRFRWHAVHAGGCVSPDGRLHWALPYLDGNSWGAPCPAVSSPCEAKRRLLFTLRVSSYRLSALRCRVVVDTRRAVVSPWFYEGSVMITFLGDRWSSIMPPSTPPVKQKFPPFAKFDNRPT